MPDDAPPHLPRLRPALAGLPTYVPGRSAAGALDVAHKLSSNENPYPPLPSVLEVVSRAALGMNRYPDLLSTRLVTAVADRLGVPVEQVVAGTGSVALLGQVVAATAGPGDEVLYAWRSFEAYPIYVGIAGATSVRVPLTADGRHDLPAMAAAVTSATRLVLVCTPNNPTGPVVHRDELVAFLDAVPPDVLVVVDEAYAEFVRDPLAPDALALQRERPNVLVLRTFSKAYGLAGLRVGYAVAHPTVAAALRQTAVPFGVSTVAEEAAVASLSAQDELLARVDLLVDERERVVRALRDGGWRLPDSQANFVWLELGPRTAAFVEAAAGRGLAVRPFATGAPTDGVRCTVAEAAANDVLLEVCALFDQDG